MPILIASDTQHHRFAVGANWGGHTTRRPSVELVRYITTQKSSIEIALDEIVPTLACARGHKPDAIKRGNRLIRLPHFVPGYGAAVKTETYAELVKSAVSMLFGLEDSNLTAGGFARRQRRPMPRVLEVCELLLKGLLPFCLVRRKADVPN